MKYASWIGLLATLSASAVVAAPTDLPTGGSVVAGSATIGTAGSVMTVTSSSTRSVLTWNTFNIGASAQVNFAQPGSGSAVLNRVTGSDVSQLFGTISSNGNVFLVNPNGVVMGASTQFNLPSITINTATNTPSDADFMAGMVNGFNTPASGGGDMFANFTASGDATLAIGGTGTFGTLSVNNLTIHTSSLTPGGCAGPCIGNSDPGVIRGGSITVTPSTSSGSLFAGQGANILLLSGQSLQSGNSGGNLTISSGTAQNLIEKGQFKASGGEAQITLQGASEIMSTLINTGSLTNATTITVSGNTVSIGL